MSRAFWVPLLVAAAGALAVQAQTESSTGAGPDARQESNNLMNKNNLTSTGETVPHPGASQGAATTDLDRRIEEQNERIEKGICSNCN